MSDEIETMVRDFGTAATEIATAADQQAAAFAAKREAEAALLAKVVESIKPALRAMSSRIQSSHWICGNNSGLNIVERETHLDERGLLVIDGWKRHKDTSGNRGELDGERLYLLSDGTWATLTREGTWSAWQGEPDRWEAELDRIEPVDVVQSYKLEDVVRSIAASLAAQRKADRAASTKRALDRAERMTALATLIGGGK